MNALVGWGILELLTSLALLLITLLMSVPVLAGRLGNRTILTLLALSLSTPLVTLGFASAAFTELGGIGTTLSLVGAGAGIIPLAVVFVGLAAFDVLNFGIQYANADGRLMPRTGRVLMYFGCVLLVAAYVIFYLNTETVRNRETPEDLGLFINVPFMLGVMFLGFPYLLWTVVRKSERLIG